MNRWNRLAFVIVVVFGCLIFGLSCGKEEPVEPSTAAIAPAVESAPPIRVHGEEEGQLYRYFPSGKRKARTVSHVDRVPAENRSTVLVVPAGEGTPPGLVYVADLRKANDDGSYPYRVLTTVELDRILDETRGSKNVAKGGKPAAAGSENAASKKSDVVLYSATWCGACTTARRWLTNKGIPFQERDIEKDPNARPDMVQRAQKAGVSPSKLQGVPVIWVKGQMMMGFDPDAVLRALNG